MPDVDGVNRPARASALTQPPSPDLGQLAAAIQAHPSVGDCAVVWRSRTDGARELVAYVVTTTAVIPERLQTELQQMLPAGRSLRCVPVSYLPLTDAGNIDERALEAVPVLEPAVARRWEDRWRQCPEVDDVAVAIEDAIEPPPRAELGVSAHSTESIAEPASAAGIHQATARPAISRGESLREEPDAPIVLGDMLHRAARLHPSHGLVCLQPDESTVALPYPQLLERAERVLAGLRAKGLVPGDPVILQLDRGPEFFVGLWACVLGGFVAVPIAVAPSYRERNGSLMKLHHAWHLLDHPLILTESALVAAIGAVAAIFDTEPLRVEAVDRLLVHAPDHRAHVGKPDDVTLMLLTSGSTGNPKAVMLSHRNLLGHCAGSSQMNGFTSDDVSLNWLPLDHVGAIVMLHFCQTYPGSQQINGPTELVLKEPLRWLDWIAAYRATATWAPNFAFSLVNDRAEEILRRRWDLSSMRFIINGGEAIVARTARRFLELLAPHGLPATAIRPAWGMSETSSGAVYSDRFTRGASSDDDAFVCVGSPIPGFAMRIVDAQDRTVDEGVVGRLQVTGPQVTGGYHRNAELTRDVFTADRWFTTGDLGRIDDGRLTITGREKDVIIINGANYYSHEIEAVAETVEGIDVSYVAACAVRAAGGATDQLAIFFAVTTPESGVPDLARRIRAAVMKTVGVNPQHLVPVSRADIPKTSIGKIQRAELRQRFERGELRAGSPADAATDSASSVHRLVWRRRAATRRDQSIGPRPLVLVDEAGLGDRLCAELASIDKAPIRVVRGARFARDTDGYRIDAENPRDYDRLLEELPASDTEAYDVVHLWTYPASARRFTSVRDLEEAVDRATTSALFMVQALARRRMAARLLVVSSHSQAVAADEVVAPESGALLGLLRTARQEIPSLTVRHLDLPIPASIEDAARVLFEMGAGSSDPEVAYRGGDRHVGRLERVAVAPPGARPFKHRGLYVLTGGLGGVSAVIARHLIEEYEASVLLVGRTALPQPHTLSPQTLDDSVADRIATYRSLEALGTRLRYEAVDVCDASALKAAVERTCREWGRELDGVIHQAGAYAERPLVDETRESLKELGRAKVGGTWAVHELLAERPRAIFIGSSSVNGQFGGFGVGAYAAANAFLDSFAQYQRAAGSMNSYSVAWSLWDERGMSRGYKKKDLARARGYRALTAQDALRALEVSLAQPPGHVLVGLDEGSRHIRSYLQGGRAGACTLRAYLGGPTVQPMELPSPDTLPDDFGTATTCPGVKIGHVPRTPAGELDRDALRKVGKPEASIAPRTELERVVASIWREVLELATIGVDDNFFDLGGDSLRIAQLGRRLSETLNRDVALTDLYEHPTVATLAARLGAGAEPRPAETDEADRRGAARRSRATRRARPASGRDREEQAHDVE